MTAIGSVVTAAVVVVALLIAIWQVFEARRTRHGEVFFDLSRRWDEELLKEARYNEAKSPTPEALRDRLRDLRKKRAEEYYILVRVPNFIEDLAIMIERKIVSYDDVLASLGTPVLAKWERWEPSVMFEREVSERSSAYEHFELLAVRVRGDLGLATPSSGLALAPVWDPAGLADDQRW
jgi:hypothetical protein